MANWLIFGGWGPAFGAVTFVLVLMGLAENPDWFSSIGFLLFFGLPPAYVVGFPFAMGTCFVIRKLQQQRVPYEPIWVAGIGLLPGLLLGFVSIVTESDLPVGLVLLAKGGSPISLIEAYGPFLLIGFIPTVACWLLSKRLANRSEISTL